MEAFHRAGHKDSPLSSDGEHIPLKDIRVREQVGENDFIVCQNKILGPQFLRKRMPTFPLKFEGPGDLHCLGDWLRLLKTKVPPILST